MNKLTLQICGQVFMRQKFLVADVESKSCLVWNSFAAMTACWNSNWPSYVWKAMGSAVWIEMMHHSSSMTKWLQKYEYQFCRRRWWELDSTSTLQDAEDLLGQNIRFIVCWWPQLYTEPTEFSWQYICAIPEWRSWWYWRAKFLAISLCWSLVWDTDELKAEWVWWMVHTTPPGPCQLTYQNLQHVRARRSSMDRVTTDLSFRYAQQRWHGCWQNQHGETFYTAHQWNCISYTAWV